MRRRLLPLFIAAALTAPALVSAQSVTMPDAAAGPRRDEATALDTIVVTGEKTERTLQETTTSVAVTTDQRIEQENIATLSDVINRTANVASTYGDVGFTIRGIANIGGGGDSPLSTVYLDGSALPSGITDGGPTSMWDLSQVELLRGPQSTIQGENALAGAIVLRTQDPTFDWEGRARVLWSDPSDRSLAFAGGGPLLADELAFRVAVEDRDFDGYTRNITRNAPEDAIDSRLARAKLLWTPSAWSDFSARLSYTKSDRDGPYIYNYSRIDTPDFFDDRVATADTPNTGGTVVEVANLELDYAMSDAWSLSAVTAWNAADIHRRYDGDNGPLPDAHGYSDQTNDTRSQELRLQYDGERVNGLVGAYWSRRDAYNSAGSETEVVTPVGTIAGLLQQAGFPAADALAVAQLYAQALPGVPVEYASLTPTQSENLALFADGELALGERTWLLGGFRYDTQDFTLANDTTTRFIGTYPDPAAFGAPDSLLYQTVASINQAVAGFVAQAAGTIPESTRDFDAFLPRLGVRFDASDDVSLSFVVQRGYRSGGSSFNVARTEVHAYDPEYTTNYEGALRTQWLDDRLTLNANVYYIDWTDKQAVAYFGLNDYDNHTVNAGRAHLYGLEIESSYRASPMFDWYASVGHARTQYDAFETVVGGLVNDFAGQEFSFAPRYTAAAGMNVRVGDGWIGNLNASWRDSVYNDVGASALKLQARTLVNAKIGYETLNWSTYVFANNLLDEEYIQYRWSDQGFGILGAPRVVGVGLEARW